MAARSENSPAINEAREGHQPKEAGWLFFVALIGGFIALCFIAIKGIG